MRMEAGTAFLPHRPSAKLDEVAIGSVVTTRSAARGRIAHGR